MQRLVLITGAAKGIGAAIAFELNKSKTKTNFFLMDKNESHLNETKKRIICFNFFYYKKYDPGLFKKRIKQKP